jgi:ribosomal protein S18 acetylase RimI-like enzyme
MGELRVRDATTTANDERFLREMLVEAVAWRAETARPSVEAALAAPHIALYVEGWGRPGDVGVIAEKEGQPLGAGWYRLFTDTKHGYGFIESSVPELTVSVLADARGRGVGTSLLRALVNHARTDGHRALSLSVEEGNPALRLYERLGFVQVKRVGNAQTMRLDL